MAAISGQPAPKPSQIDSNVPSQETSEDVQALLADFDAPAMPAAGSDSDVSSLLSQFADEPVGDQQFADESATSGIGALPEFARQNMTPGGIGEQLQNFTTRLQSGLAANDVEKMNFMKQKFGADNAVMKNGKIYFRRSNKDKLKPLDPDTLEVINDIIPDFAREIVTEIGLLPGEIAGGAMGAAAGVPGIGAGALMGRAAGVPMANAFADRIAEYAGVPQDEARNRYRENTIGIVAEAVLPVVGKKILKNIPGTSAAQLAYKESKEAGEREIIALSRQSEQVQNAISALQGEGRAAQIDGSAIGFPGANVNLMGHQLHPDSPIAMQYARQAASDPRFINAQNQLAQDWGDSLTNTLTEIGRRNNPGPYRPEVLAEKVTNAVADVQKAEGKAIGKFRTKAMANLKNQKQPLPPEIISKAQDLMKEVGFTMQAKGDSMSIKPPKNMNALVGKLGLTSTGEVNAVVNNMKELSAGFKNGFTLSDIDRLRNLVGGTADSLYRTPAGAKLGSLSGDLRAYYREAVGKGLTDDFERAAFNSAMDDFSQLMVNVGTIKGALNEDASAKAIVKSFFTGKENLAKVRAIKKISPESASALKEEWVNQLLVDYADRGAKTGFKSKQFLDAIDKKYGHEFVKEVMDDGSGVGMKEVRNLLSVTERLEQTYKKTDVDKMSEKQKEGLMNIFISAIGDVKFKTLNGISAVIRSQAPKDHVLMQIMTRDGIDKYVANYSGKVDKKSLYQQLNNMLAENKLYSDARRAGEMAKRPLKAGVKQQLQEAGSPSGSVSEE